MQNVDRQMLIFSIQIEDGESSDDKRTIKVPLSVPADDFPTAIKAQYDDESSTITLEFDYSASEEKRISKQSENYGLSYGERTGRIYQVELRNAKQANSEMYTEIASSIEQMSSKCEGDSPPRVAKNLHLGSVMLERLGPKLRQGLAVS